MSAVFPCSPYVIGTMNQGVSSSPNLELHHNFRFVTHSHHLYFDAPLWTVMASLNLIILLIYLWFIPDIAVKLIQQLYCKKKMLLAQWHKILVCSFLVSSCLSGIVCQFCIWFLKSHRLKLTSIFPLGRFWIASLKCR